MTGASLCWALRAELTLQLLVRRSTLAAHRFLAAVWRRRARRATLSDTRRPESKAQPAVLGRLETPCSTGFPPGNQYQRGQVLLQLIQGGKK